MRSRTLVIGLILSFTACGYPDPNPNRPKAPAANDPAFTAQGLDSWYLVGDAATPAQNQLTAIVTAPSGTDYVDAYIPGLKPIRMSEQNDGFEWTV